MKLGILHLSDIHLKEEVDSNPVLTKVDAIAGAVGGIPETLDEFLVIVSGDTAFSGKKAEYAHAMTFFRDLLASLQSRGITPRSIVFVPGNHDCDFTQSTDVREIVLQSRRQTFKDDTPLTQCLVVQRGYGSFLTELSESLPATDVIGLVEMVKAISIPCNKIAASVNLLNTAWCSELHEKQGQMTYPCDLLREKSDNNVDELAITIFHHPYNWLDESSARTLRSRVESCSDIVLTGHEHETEFYRKERRPSEIIDYLEGGVLQDSNDRVNSTFNLVLVDVSSQQLRASLYQWNRESEAYEVSDEIPYQQFQRNRARLSGEFPFTQEFVKWRTDVGTGFHHPRRQDLRLEDIYVFPDFRDVKQAESAEEHIYLSEAEFLRRFEVHKHALVVGSDASGKTSLAKMLMPQLREGGKIPLYIRATELESSRDQAIHKACTRSATWMYGKNEADAFWQLPVDRRVIIVDDLHRSPLSSKHRSELLTWLTAKFGKVLVLGGEELRFDELQGDAEGITLWDFKHFEMLELGFLRRSKMIGKWHSLGIESGAAEGELQRKQSETEKLVNAFLGEQLMPAHPVFVLIVLQQLETREPISTTGSSAGYLYEVLILKSLLESVFSDTDIDTNKNYLAELAYTFLSQGLTRISKHDLESWHASYCVRYKLLFPLNRQLDALLKGRLLDDEAGQISFTYPYLYYYFVATYLTRHIDQEKTRKDIENLCTYLHQEEAANIILFVCHLSRNEMVFNAVLQTADALFSGYPECDFDRDIEYLNEIVQESDERRIEGGTPEQRRQKLLEESDAARRKRGDGERDRPAFSAVEFEEKCDLQKLNDSLQLNSALKTIQIIGQILRNHVGSIEGEQKKRLVMSSFALGLRAAKCMFGLVEENIDDLVEALVGALERSQGGVPRADVLQSVKKSVWGTLRLGAFSIVRYISDSVGMERMAQSFEEILGEQRRLPLEIIDLSIKLDHFKAFPENEAIRLAGKVRKNPFAYAVVRDLVYMRFYLYQVDYRIRQRVGEKLRISIEGQKRIVHSQAKRFPPGKGRGRGQHS